jgi:hypothetical protein
MELQDLIQQHIYEHGRIRKVRLLNRSEYAVQYSDGFAHVLSDPRIGSEGPIESIKLSDGLDQMLTTNFADLWSTAIFSGSDGKRPDEEAIQSTSPALEHA